jgi:alanyl-tRNA synthetase
VDDALLGQIETAVNEAILANQSVKIAHVPQKEAIAAGAMALFGEKYGDVVRTVSIGDGRQPYSLELCGGLHVQETGDIGLFRFVSEGAVAAGVRRVEAVTGRGAQAFVADRLNLLERLADRLNAPMAEAESRLETLLADHKSQQKEIEQLRRRLARAQFESLLAEVEMVNGAALLAAQVDVADMDGLREMADWFRDKVNSGVAALAAVKDDKPILLVVVTKDLIAKGAKAGDLVREMAQIVGGGGGGRPDMAQAGGKDAGKISEALTAVRSRLQELLG